MKTAQHISGPWEVLDHKGVHVLAMGSLTIATVSHQLDCADTDGSVQIQNARLIAAAPSMLEALQKIAAYEPMTFAECSDAEAVMCLAKDAIAKATGEKS